MGRGGKGDVLDSDERVLKIISCEELEVKTV